MKRFLLLMSLMAGISTPFGAAADACLNEFRGFFATAMDPFQRPPHRLALTVYSAQGDVVRVIDNIAEDPLHTIGTVRGAGHATLANGRAVFSGPGPEGPWTNTGALMPEGRAESLVQHHQDQIANLSGVVCHGIVEQQGTTYLAYSWTSQTNPDAQGNYFGATNTGYFDPDTRLPVIIDQSRAVSSWAPEPSDERMISVFQYEPGLTVPRPGQ